MEDTDAAYVAGIIDGEGSISCGYQNSGVPQLFVAVGMMKEIIPKYLHEQFGGTFYQSKGGAYQWQVNGASCREILAVIRPYVKIKRREVDLALAFVETVRLRDNRKALTDAELLVKLKLAEDLRRLTGGSHKCHDGESLPIGGRS